MTDRSPSDGAAMTDGFGGVVNGSTFIRRTLVWGIGLAVAATAMYLMQDQLRDLLSSGTRLRTIRPGWFGVMFACWSWQASCACGG